MNDDTRIEWGPDDSAQYLWEQAEKADRVAGRMEREARRFRSIAEHLRSESIKRTPSNVIHGDIDKAEDALRQIPKADS